MNIGRVKQIMHSKKNIPVYYKNTPVHIEKIIRGEDRVRVKNMNNGEHLVLGVKTINENHGMIQ